MVPAAFVAGGAFLLKACGKKKALYGSPFGRRKTETFLPDRWICYLRHMTISELENWFKANPMPSEPVMLNPATKINSIQHFLESHFYPLKLDPSNKINQPLLDRLLDLKLLIESNL
ncbi:DUF6965 family protein [Pedobacter namyangjuensis]|uniref:DUF6965 family protein n=1 Tax=Pedobacter namyangjuensis TaxID=600626 RepID=UPI001F060333|nr:hypothetical protein [Pedobacter namyangjuensis]